MTIDAISSILAHEFGHSLYNNSFTTFVKDYDLSTETKNILNEAREKIKQNPEPVISYLKEANIIRESEFKNTVNWYSNIRETEVKRIEEVVDKLFQDNANSTVENRKEIVAETLNIPQIQKILTDAGLDISEIDSYINEKELMKSTLQGYNNIKNQEIYFDSKMASYQEAGAARKIMSMTNSLVQ